jgi:hypothetical protein
MTHAAAAAQPRSRGDGGLPWVSGGDLQGEGIVLGE